MYYVYYGIIKLFSLFPLSALYALSDFIAFLMHRVFKYRYEVVMKNLSIAFPEKTEAWRREIARKFYLNLTDTFIETIKTFSWSNEKLFAHFTVDAEEINARKEKSQSLTVVSGHFFNWEWANLVVSHNIKLPFIGVYMPLKNSAMDKVLYGLRKRTGTLLVPATDFKEKVKAYADRQHCLILVADQSPASPDRGIWLPFFGKPTPFLRGPETNARRNDTAVFYADFYRVKRGVYHCETEWITDDPLSFEPNELTFLLAKKVEESIRKRPDNYLWSHRRWKFDWKPEYGEVYAG